jgi:hypothetical protein
LQKGDNPNEFQITGGGKICDLSSTSSVPVQDYLGYKVKITGSNATKTLNAAEKAESVAGHLLVKKLKIVSKTCP